MGFKFNLSAFKLGHSEAKQDAMQRAEGRAQSAERRHCSMGFCQSRGWGKHCILVYKVSIVVHVTTFNRWPRVRTSALCLGFERGRLIGPRHSQMGHTIKVVSIHSLQHRNSNLYDTGRSRRHWRPFYKNCVSQQLTQTVSIHRISQLELKSRQGEQRDSAALHYLFC